MIQIIFYPFLFFGYLIMYLYYYSKLDFNYDRLKHNMLECKEAWEELLEQEYNYDNNIPRKHAYYCVIRWHYFLLFKCEIINLIKK